jgi:hypothetical protein
MVAEGAGVEKFAATVELGLGGSGGTDSDKLTHYLLQCRSKAAYYVRTIRKRETSLGCTRARVRRPPSLPPSRGEGLPSRSRPLSLSISLSHEKWSASSSQPSPSEDPLSSSLFLPPLRNGQPRPSPSLPLSTTIQRESTLACHDTLVP